MSQGLCKAWRVQRWSYIVSLLEDFAIWLGRGQKDRQTGQIEVSNVRWEHRGDWARLKVQQGFLDERILNIPSITKSRKSALTSLSRAVSHGKVPGRRFWFLALSWGRYSITVSQRRKQKQRYVHDTYSVSPELHGVISVSKGYTLSGRKPICILDILS